jgi:hypothetical protein
MTRVSHLKNVRQRFKTFEDYTFCRESYGQRFLGLSGRIIHGFSDRTVSHQRSQPFFQNDEVDQSKASVSSTTTLFRTPPVRQQEHRRKCVGGGVLPHCISNPGLAPSDFHLFGSLKEALRLKRFRANKEVKLVCKNGWTSNHNIF